LLYFVLKRYLIKANREIEYELKTATKILTNQLSRQLDHKCIYNIHECTYKCTYNDWVHFCVQLGAGKPAGAPGVHV